MPTVRARSDLPSAADAARDGLVIHRRTAAAPELDAATGRVALRTPGAVLVLPPEAGIWPPARALVPVRERELDDGVPLQARLWVERLASGRGGVELRVLHLAATPDQWHASAGRVQEEVRRCADAGAAEVRVRLHHCVRWGALTEQRIARWLEAYETDLLVLHRPVPPREEPAEGDHAWYHLLRRARCATLLLPLQPHPRAGADDRPAQPRDQE